MGTFISRGGQWYNEGMDDAKEEVRARLSIEDVIGEYVQLKRAGRNFKGLSPFTSEKTPSFIVSPEKQIWHDFSSNKGGDVFSFIMEVEGVDFRQSLEQLARKAGVDLSMYQTKGRDAARRKKVLLEATRLAAAYYQHSLLKNPRALEYIFKKRGFTKETVGEFRIGYAPDQGSALVQFLTKKGFSKQDLGDAGLTNRFGTDLFRGRMIIPLLDESGQAIGFTGRIIADDPNAPKYLNTPATLLYDKSRHIFGFSQAKEAIRKEGYSVLVEGNLDVVSSHQAGVRTVVATAGTALTEHQLKALRRMSGQVRLAFDGDKAGVAATERAIPIASRLGISLTVVTLPDGAKDPDELIQQDVSLWKNAIEAAEPAVDWVLAQYQLRYDLHTAEGKRLFSSAALDVIKGLHDPVEQSHYQQLVADMTGVSLEVIAAKMTAAGTERAKPLKSTAKASTGGSSPAYTHIDTALGAGLRYLNLRPVFKDIPPDTFDDDRQQAVTTYLLAHDDYLPDELPPELREINEYVNVVLLRAEKRYEGWREEDMRLEIAELLRQYRTEQQKKALEKQIRSAEERGDEAEIERLRREHYVLIKETKRGQ
jgi:DNA primase